LLAVGSAAAVVGSVVSYFDEAVEMRRSLLEHGTTLARQAAWVFPDAVVPPGDIPLLESYVADLVATDQAVALAGVARADGTVLASAPTGAQPVFPDGTIAIEEPIVVERGGEKIGSFFLGLTTAPMERVLRERATRMFVQSSITCLLVGAVLWLVLRSVVVGPLRRLDAEAQRLARGELAAPLPDFGETELGRLGRTMDEMRRNLRESQESLAAQNKSLLELDCAKRQFLANMSHEMRTPMTSILGGIEQLAGVSLSAAEREVEMAAVQRNGEHLLELVDRLLDLAKLESGNLLIEKRPCAPGEILERLGTAMQPVAVAKGLQLRLDLTALRGVKALSDPLRLRQLVTFIVDNAVKFTVQGHVELTARLHGSGTQRHLQIVVADTGPGIPAEFGDGAVPFQQVDGSLTRRHGGSGLGLYMARQIANCLGGSVKLESELGRGTSVHINVPIEMAPAAPPAAASSKRAGRVLVVDDAADNQRLLKALLSRLGLTVELANNGRDAVDRMLASHAGEPFDLVLMDMQMPELDGLGAIRELRAHGFTLPIVSLTAHAMADDRDRCLAAGASGYETKPISLRRLTELVARFVGDRAPAASR
jgi:signal transduction histidine kinase/ActR/RegA family two-component response regulator